jgi:hypothetical protein
LTKCRPRKAVRLGAPITHTRQTAYRATDRHTTHLLQGVKPHHGAYVQCNNAWARAVAHRSGARCWANEARVSNHWCVSRRWKAPVTHTRPSLHIPARPTPLPRQNGRRCCSAPPRNTRLHPDACFARCPYEVLPRKTSVSQEKTTLLIDRREGSRLVGHR